MTSPPVAAAVFANLRARSVLGKHRCPQDLPATLRSLDGVITSSSESWVQHATRTVITVLPSTFE